MITITSKRIYEFKDQFQKQEKYFKRTLEWLDRLWEPEILRRATQREEKLGFDAVMDIGGVVYHIEVKTEFSAERTRNLVFETVSIAQPHSMQNVLGWGLKDWFTHVILYIVPGKDEVYGFDFEALQTWVLDPPVYRTLKGFAAQNLGYVTLGVLMPIEILLASQALDPMCGNLNTKIVSGSRLFDR